ALIAGSACAPWRGPSGPGAEPETMRGAIRRDHDGWIFVHLEGTPERLGFQHGSLLADEIAGMLADMAVAVQRASKAPWSFYRESAQRIFWPRVPDDLRAEIKGIVAGARARGKKLDEWDIVAANAYLEIAWYYLPKLREQMPVAGAKTKPPGMCSAFIATG